MNNNYCSLLLLFGLWNEAWNFFNSLAETQMIDIRIIVDNVAQIGGPANRSQFMFIPYFQFEEEEEEKEEEKGFPSEHEQGRSIWSAIMSVEGPVENFLSQYLESKLNLIVGSHRIGSLWITVECRSLQILEELWEDYCSGHFNEMAQEMIVTPYVLAQLGVTDVKLKTFISEEEYERGKQIFMDNSGELIVNVQVTSVFPILFLATGLVVQSFLPIHVVTLFFQD